MENFRLDEPAFRTAMARSMVAPPVKTADGSRTLSGVGREPNAGTPTTGDPAVRPETDRPGLRLRIEAEVEADQRSLSRLRRVSPAPRYPLSPETCHARRTPPNGPPGRRRT